MLKLLCISDEVFGVFTLISCTEWCLLETRMSPDNRTDCRSDCTALLKLKERAEDRINKKLADKMKQTFSYLP